MSTFTARPTTYNGIAMRSRLEATVAAALDRCGCEWTYESQAFATSEGQYMPDFRVVGLTLNRNRTPLPDPVWLEVRPTWERVDSEVAKRERRIFFANEGALLYVGIFAATPLLGEVHLEKGKALAVICRGVGSLAKTPSLLAGFYAETWLAGWNEAQ